MNVYRCVDNNQQIDNKNKTFLKSQRERDRNPIPLTTCMHPTCNETMIALYFIAILLFRIQKQQKHLSWKAIHPMQLKKNSGPNFTLTAID